MIPCYIYNNKQGEMMNVPTDTVRRKAAVGEPPPVESPKNPLESDDLSLVYQYMMQQEQPEKPASAFTVKLEDEDDRAFDSDTEEEDEKMRYVRYGEPFHLGCVFAFTHCNYQQIPATGPQAIEGDLWATIAGKHPECILAC